MKKILTIIFIFIIKISIAQTSVSILDFGATNDGSTDCSNALISAMNALPQARTAWGIPAYGHGTVYFPRGIYQFNSRININTTITLEGLGSGSFPYQEVQLRFNGTGGIKILADTKGFGARGVTIKNMYLRNFGSSTDSTADGIWTNTRVIFDNVAVDAFGGNGFAFVTNDSGNANNSMMINCTAYYCAKSGLFLSGNESNNISIYSSNFSANGMCGVLDNSFLGNGFFVNHVSFNGVRNASTYSKSWARHGGKCFQSIKYPNQKGIEPQVTSGWQNYWVENNTTFGDTTLTAQWSADSTYWITGAYVVTGTAATSTFMGCYSEGGEGKSLMNEFSICYGGDHGAGFVFNKNLWLHQSASRLLLHGAGFKSYHKDSLSTFFGFDEGFGIVTGSEKSGHSQTQFIYSEPDRTTNMFNDNSLNNLTFRIIGKGYDPSRLGLTTLPRTGGIIIPYYQPIRFQSTSNGNIARGLYGTTSTPPTGNTYAIGDFVLYMGSDSTIIGYRCISTSPLTWKTLKAAN